MNNNFFFLTVFLLFAIGCGSKNTEDKTTDTSSIDRPAAAIKKTKSQDAFEMIDGVGLVKIELGGFDKLPIEKKKLVYYYYLASNAGDDIFYDQLGKQNLKIKKILDGIAKVEGHIPIKIRKKIEPYTELFWMNHGVHDSWTGEKNLPTFIPGELLAAANIAISKGQDIGVGDFEGASLDANRIEQLEALSHQIRPWMFDENIAPVRIEKDPPEGEDILSASANNFYENIKLSDLDAFTERYPLNSRLVKEDEKIVEQVYRAGRPGSISKGLYAKELTQIIGHLRGGLPFMEADSKAAIERLIAFFETGSPEAFEQYNKLWIKTSSSVETIIGFIEQYDDPRGVKGSFEALVAIRDEEATTMMKKVAEQAAFYEQKMPWDDEYKKTSDQIITPSAGAYQLVVATGDAGPVSPVGVNLPNDEKLRQTYGHKNLFFTNVLAAKRKVSGHKVIDEFSVDALTAERRKKWDKVALSAHVALHEVIGHGSGKTDKNLVGLPEDHLKEYAGAIEEMRAELVALYQAFEPKSIEIGLIPEIDCAKARYDSYASQMLEQLDKVRDSDKLVQPHMQARQTIVKFAIEKGTVSVVKKEGHFYTKVLDYEKMRLVLGELLSKVQKIKATGDYAGAKVLIKKYGTRVSNDWRADVRARWKKLNIPSKLAYVYPLLRPKRDATGQIVDIEVIYPDGLRDRQMKILDK